MHTDDAAFEICKKENFPGQTIQLFCYIGFVLYQPDSSRALCRTDSFVTLLGNLFSLLYLADVLCLDGLGTFDLLRKIRDNTG